ncbi:MAG: hypothetical protein ACYC35_00960 [Pirellulales bacterium]
MSTSTDYYVYLYRDPRDNLPFYVGMGRRNRDRWHWTDLVRLINPGRRREEPLPQTPLCRRLAKLHAVGKSPIIERPCQNLSELEAADMERTIIARLGCVCFGTGPLLNQSVGGESRHGKHAPTRIDWGDALAKVASLAGKIPRPGGKGVGKSSGSYAFQAKFGPIYLGVARTFDEAKEMCRQAEQTFDLASCLEVA